ncbi:MAG: hypothetical protein P8X70_01895 [Nanoarchaeota archaeon]
MEAVIQLKNELEGAEKHKEKLERQLLYLKNCIQVLRKELEYRKI